MPAKSKPYEQFGPYILYKKLEADSLGDLWRAARIENHALGAMVALRRLTGGDRAAMVAAAQSARQISSLLSGTSFVRDQRVEIIQDIPALAWDYSGGRSLRHVVDRARGGTGSTARPIPLDQAIVIAEKVALSLATTEELRYNAERLTHGALIPQFIWITDEGEIRVAGQQFGPALVASLKNGAVASEIRRYFSPEYQTSGKATKSSEVFSLGAILYLLVTGQEPPDAMSASAFGQAVRATRTTTGTAIPDDLRAILDKSLAIDPASRFPSVGEMKQSLSALANSGKYSATTFNLAFYLSTLLKKEMEGEALEREKESKVSVVPYLETLAATAPAVSRVSVERPAPKRSRLPLMMAAVLAVAVAAAAGFFLYPRKESTPAPAVAATTPVPAAPQRAIPLPEPIVASPSADTSTTEVSTSTAPAVDPNAQKRAFEEAVKRKLQEEMMKLQAEHTRQLQQQQSRNAPILSSAPIASKMAAEEPEEEELSAAELDRQRRDAAALAAATNTATVAPAQQPPAVATNTLPAQPPPVAPQPSGVPAAPVVREGDVVDISEVDTPPRAVRPARPVYPPIAARQRIVATIMATILISEEGEVLDVKILKGDPRFGFNDAATRALRGARYSPAVKSGRRVRTWLPQIIEFKP